LNKNAMSRQVPTEGKLWIKLRRPVLVAGSGRVFEFGYDF
jgi:hypothetical protein